MADAYLQLGILYADQRKYRTPFAQYDRPPADQSESGQYSLRLGQALVRPAMQTRARQEFAVFERLPRTGRRR